ncbi:uncharacterized protein LOC144425835 isoform X2 [Styela clava]
MEMDSKTLFMTCFVMLLILPINYEVDAAYGRNGGYGGYGRYRGGYSRYHRYGYGFREKRSADEKNIFEDIDEFIDENLNDLY